MDEEKNELAPLDEVKKEYVINIQGGDKNREIRLSAGLYKLGIATFFVGLIILIGACGYSIYSALNVQRNAEIVREIQQAEKLQQEQLVTISKKAAELSEAVQNITQQEKELRIQAGLKPPKEETSEDQPVWAPPTAETQPSWAPVTQSAENSSTSNESVLTEELDAEYNGQGGPIGDLTIEEVSEALAMLEASVNLRKESLDDFQAELKRQREQMEVAVASAANAAEMRNTQTYDYSTYSYSSAGSTSTWTPRNTTTSGYDLSKFGGNPAADSHMPSIWPTTGSVSSPYGLRWNGSDFHPGMDIANDMGTPIVATADGVVDYAGWNDGGYGNMVDIDHGNGIMTRYGHASQVVVSAGQQVKRGQVIAYMGSTGFSTGPHVHYEVIINGQRVNPSSYL